MVEEIKYKREARNLLKQGVDTLVDAVKITLGPKGKNVIISENGVPHVTKDGVTVAKSIHLKDPYMNLGAELIKQAASKTVSEVGDNTSSCCILAQAIIDQGLKAINEGYNSTEIKSGIDKAVALITACLEEKSIPINTSDEPFIKNIAMISANNDEEIGEKIAEIFKQIGLEGAVRVEESEYSSTEIEVAKGMKINRGFVSPVFINTPTKGTVEYDNPIIHIVNGKISYMSDIKAILEKAVNSNRPIVIIAEDYDSLVLSNLSLNNSKGIVKVCPIKSPGFGDRKQDLLEDISILTKTEESLEDIKGYNTITSYVHSAKKVIIDVESTLIIGGLGIDSEINDRVKMLKKSMSNSKSNADKEDFKKRIANLIGGIATIYVGAPTEIEMKELKDRYDDAICAVQAAIKGGISVGGGVSYIDSYFYASTLAPEELQIPSEELIGFNLLLEAILEVPKQLLYNANKNYEEESSKYFEAKENIGYNVKTDKWENLLEAGVIDPTNSLISALQNAASVASMFLTTECAIILDTE